MFEDSLDKNNALVGLALMESQGNLINTFNTIDILK